MTRTSPGRGRCRVVDDPPLGTALRGTAATRAMGAGALHPDGPAVRGEAEARGQGRSGREGALREVRRGRPAGDHVLELTQAQVDQGLPGEGIARFVASRRARTSATRADSSWSHRARRRRASRGGSPATSEEVVARGSGLTRRCVDGGGQATRAPRSAGAVRARATGHRATMSSSASPSARPRRTTDIATPAPVVVASPLEQGPGQDLVAVHRRQVGPDAAQDLEELGVAEVDAAGRGRPARRRPDGTPPPRAPGARRAGDRPATRWPAGAPGPAGPASATPTAGTARPRAGRGRRPPARDTVSHQGRARPRSVGARHRPP